MKQGEYISFLGKVSRRERESTGEFTQLTDLSGLDIYVSIQRQGREVVRPVVTYSEGLFTTAPLETTTLRGDYRVEVGFLVDGTAIISANTESLVVAASPLGMAIAQAAPVATAQISSGSIADSGHWEYRVELAQSGDTMNISGWSSREQLVFDMGAVFVGEKGEKGDGYTLTDEDKEEIAKFAKMDVDPTPVEDSENAVSSGGVYDALQNIEAETVTTTGDVNVGDRVIAEGYIRSKNGNVFTNDGNVYTSNGDIYTSKGEIYSVEGDIRAYDGSFYKGSGDDKVEVAYKDELSAKTSDLTNDSGFIDKTAENLVNYYLKSETFSRAEAWELLEGVASEDYVDNQLATKVDTVEGKSLSTNDFTDTLKSQLEATMSATEVAGAIINHNESTTAHADLRALIATRVGLPTYDATNYKITFTAQNGTTTEIDLPIESMGLRYNSTNNAIEFDNADGSVSSIPVSDFIEEYVGSIGDHIQITIGSGNVIQAMLIDGSIDLAKLSTSLQSTINSKANAADVYTKAESQSAYDDVKAYAEGYTDTSIDSLTFSSVNLLDNSNWANGTYSGWGNNGGTNSIVWDDDLGQYVWKLVATSLGQGLYTWSNGAGSIIVGDEYTCSLRIKTETDGLFSIGIGSDFGDASEGYQATTTSWTTISTTRTIAGAGLRLFALGANTYYVTDIMLVKGNKIDGTWSPSINDINEAIADAKQAGEDAQAAIGDIDTILDNINGE